MSHGPPAKKPAMYRLKNPDPLREHSIRSIAELAGCSKETVRRLRTGAIADVSYDIAYGICTALGRTMNDLFEPSGRTVWER